MLQFTILCLVAAGGADMTACAPQKGPGMGCADAFVRQGATWGGGRRVKGGAQWAGENPSSSGRTPAASSRPSDVGANHAAGAHQAADARQAAASRMEAAVHHAAGGQHAAGARQTAGARAAAGSRPAGAVPHAAGAHQVPPPAHHGGHRGGLGRGHPGGNGRGYPGGTGRGHSGGNGRGHSEGRGRGPQLQAGRGQGYRGLGGSAPPPYVDPWSAARGSTGAPAAQRNGWGPGCQNQGQTTSYPEGGLNLDPDPAPGFLARRDGAPVTFAEAHCSLSGGLPGPFPGQVPRVRSAPPGGLQRMHSDTRPDAHHNTDGRLRKSAPPSGRPSPGPPRQGSAAGRGYERAHAGGGTERGNTGCAAAAAGQTSANSQGAAGAPAEQGFGTPTGERIHTATGGAYEERHGQHGSVAPMAGAAGLRLPPPPHVRGCCPGGMSPLPGAPPGPRMPPPRGRGSTLRGVHGVRGAPRPFRPPPNTAGCRPGGEPARPASASRAQTHSAVQPAPEQPRSERPRSATAPGAAHRAGTQGSQGATGAAEAAARATMPQDKERGCGGIGSGFGSAAQVPAELIATAHAHRQRPKPLSGLPGGWGLSACRHQVAERETPLRTLNSKPEHTAVGEPDQAPGVSPAIASLVEQVAAAAERKLRRRDREARKRRHSADTEGVVRSVSGQGAPPPAEDGSRGSSGAEGASRAVSAADVSALVRAYVDGLPYLTQNPDPRGGRSSAKRARQLHSGSGDAASRQVFDYSGAENEGRCTAPAGAPGGVRRPTERPRSWGGSCGEGAGGLGPCAPRSKAGGGPDLKALRVQAMRSVLAQLQQ